jgi:hypothetical protein
MRADGLNPGSCPDRALPLAAHPLVMRPLLFDHLLERLGYAAGTPKPPAS